MWLWGHSLLKISSPGPFMEPGDYQDAPVSKTLHFIRIVGLLEGWNRGGRTIDPGKVAVQGSIKAYSLFIHSFIFATKLGCTVSFSSSPHIAPSWSHMLKLSVKHIPNFAAYLSTRSWRPTGKWSITASIHNLGRGTWRALCHGRFTP
jgi:hypothetical protein